MGRVKEELWEETEDNGEVLPPDYDDYLNELYSSEEFNEWLDSLDDMGAF